MRARAIFTSRRVIQAILAGLVVVLACAAFGIATAHADGYVGPHKAHFAVAVAQPITVDVGPLGTVQMESPVAPLGARVTIGEIPADVTEITPSATMAGLSSDLGAYLQFMSDPAATIRAAVRSLVVDASIRTALAILVVVGVVMGVRLALGPVRRRELAATASNPRTMTTAAVATLSIVGLGIFAADSPEFITEPIVGSPVFNGTALAGTRVTGRLASVIDVYGSQLIDVYNNNEKFYAEAQESMEHAWDQRARNDIMVNIARASTPRFAGDDSASDGPEQYVTVLVVSDLHCNMSMTPLMNSIAKRAGVNLVINAGDTTMNGTSVEKVCVDSFNGIRPPGVPMVTITGNHDSADTAKAARDKGQIVLDGDAVEVAGLRILGTGDPKATRVGQGSTAVGAETREEVAEAMAQTACESRDVDLLLIHTPRDGNVALDSGCVPFQMSGDTHRRHDPDVVGQGIRYVSASTAGAASGKLTVGPLGGTAEMAVFRFDTETRRFVSWKLVEVNPDKSASVSRWLPIPQAPMDEQVVAGKPNSAA
ncbi:MAG: metallophosphoesterase family protein [Cellulomonadaceae bacterium]|jgi:hypothetical protein|nr:metallophosphoesterase family protein [Cellulomonadaceae bacterium]